jgi:uncharacterized protein (TIGR02996 family)
MVLADPDDDGARQIYADALLEEGDPRGEFIAIQFKLVRGAASPDDVLRLRELYRSHEALWLGELAQVLGGRVYRAGFLERAVLRPVPDGDQARSIWKSASLDSRLGTVRVLEPGEARAEVYRQFALSPAMNHLREVSILSRDMFDEVAARGARWSFSCLVFECEVDRSMLDRVFSAASLLQVRELAFRARPEHISELTDLLAEWPGRERVGALSLLVPTDVRANFNRRPFTSWLSSNRSLAPVPRLGLWLPLSRIYAHAVDTGRGLEVEVRDDLLLADVLGELTGFDELIVAPPPREACCNLDSPWHLAAAIRRLNAGRVQLPERWQVTLARGY